MGLLGLDGLFESPICELQNNQEMAAEDALCQEI